MAEPQRLQYVDHFRGLLIVHMALDHASAIMNKQRWGDELAAHNPGMPGSLAQFIARFTGVAVAPGFAFMAGFMIALTTLRREGRGQTKREVTRQLITRGIVLIVADATVGGIFRAAQGFYSFMVLSSIGASIIIIALIRDLPRVVLTAIALAIVVLHPLLDVSGLPVPLRAVIYEPIREGYFRSLYPIIPWVGVVLLGFVLGADAAVRERPRKLWLGLAGLSFALFFGVRVSGGFGNAYPHEGLGTLGFWIFAKYPPDLAWITWSFWQIFLVLAVLHWVSERGPAPVLKPFALFGRVPFFFYLTHFYLLGIMTMATGGKRGLKEAVLLWVVGVALMFPICRWYDRKKRERPNWVTRYV